jgi:poly-gamma-glutamate capsule biosynthesis protein CapA/YwtB (metallophosphatase superfamily)
MFFKRYLENLKLKEKKSFSLILSFSLKVIFLLFLSTYLFAGSISVIAVGDIMMGSDYPDANLPPHGGSKLFANVSSILKDADLTLGNLEGTLLKGGVCAKQVKKGSCYAFRTPPGWATNLRDAGFDFLNLANNHMNDFGPGGINGTTEALSDAGLKYGGAYKKVGQLNVNGTKVAVISFSTSPNTNSILEIEEAQKIVAEQAEINDIVIVSFHGGAEGLKALHTSNELEYFLGSPRGNIVKFARAVIDSGADFVWGHGPHVPRAMEIYKDRLIAYSLGNFCTWGFNLVDELGYAPILKVEMDSSGVFKKGNIFSAVQKTYKPSEPDSMNLAAKLIKELSEDDFPQSSPIILDNGEFYPR